MKTGKMKRTRFIKLYVFFFLFPVMLMSAGCNYLFPTEENRAEVFLEQKYGEDFTYIRTVEYFGYGSQEAFLFSSDSHPDAEILARYDTSTGKHKDNYMDIMYENQACETVKKSLKKVYGDAPVAICMYDYRESDLPDVYSFEDYMTIQTPNLLAVMYYDIPEEKVREYIDRTDMTAANSELPYNLVLFIETDEPGANGYNRNQIISYAAGNTYDHCLMLGDLFYY